MPSPGEDIQSWSTTAANNGTADPLIVWSEGQARASVNNSSRSEMAAIAKWRNLLNGSIVTTGSKNAQAFLSGLTYTTIPTNLVVRLKIGSGLTNDASATLNMDGLGDTLIKTTDGRDILGGELVGDGYADLLYNGINWIFLYSREFIDNQLHGGGGVIIGTQIFSTAGTFTYTPTTGTEACIIECIGGGGAGGGAASVLGTSVQAGGGGSGGYSRKYATAADIGASQVATVGAAGIGSGGHGTAGGTTSLGSLCIANGGGGGYAGNIASALAPNLGAGAAPGTGDIATGGTAGGYGFYNADNTTVFIAGGNGGTGPWGGGVNTGGATNGTAGAGYGAGGSGGASFNGSPTLVTGGNGSAGCIIITEFAGRGAPGRDGEDGPQGPIGPAGPAGAGTGDVLVSGTPSAGQIAQWTDASHIAGVAVSTIGAVTSVVVQKFTASGTYTPTANMKYCIIECVGGGGSGGGAAGGGTGYYFSGGGGGSGGYSRTTASAAAIGASQTVTVGAGGAVAGGHGLAGGTTSVGTLCVANGGSGGLAVNVSLANPSGGAGGTAGIGDVAAAGTPGGTGEYEIIPGSTSTGESGYGGSSYFGGGALGRISASSATAGFDAGAYGSGGSGASTANTVGSAVSGAGSAGLVIITEFI